MIFFLARIETRDILAQRICKLLSFMLVVKPPNLHKAFSRLLIEARRILYLVVNFMVI
jgi:hypothetical protein